MIDTASSPSYEYGMSTAACSTSWDAKFVTIDSNYQVTSVGSAIACQGTGT